MCIVDGGFKPSEGMKVMGQVSCMATSHCLGRAGLYFGGFVMIHTTRVFFLSCVNRSSREHKGGREAGKVRAVIALSSQPCSDSRFATL